MRGAGVTPSLAETRGPHGRRRGAPSLPLTIIARSTDTDRTPKPYPHYSIQKYLLLRQLSRGIPSRCCRCSIRSSSCGLVVRQAVGFRVLLGTGDALQWSGRCFWSDRLLVSLRRDEEEALRSTAAGAEAVVLEGVGMAGGGWSGSSLVSYCAQPREAAEIRALDPPGQIFYLWSWSRRVIRRKVDSFWVLLMFWSIWWLRFWGNLNFFWSVFSYFCMGYSQFLIFRSPKMGAFFFN